MHILLIEDDQDDVELFQYALHSSRVICQLEVIMDGDRVQSHLQASTKRPDVIVMDLNLPRISGRDLLQQIRTLDGFSQVPLIVMTTSSADDDRIFCLAKGANQFIIKPSSLDAFAQIVAAIVELALTGNQPSPH
ncbi:response regulator [Spirosoma lacussanchae]|uniref:response regulator n=1 Tax=Spirosoma lacussanchae TaxID=1884249 RepID=UPI003D23793E